MLRLVLAQQVGKGLELLIRVKMDGQLALAIVVGHIDLTAQRLLQALLHLHRQGAARGGLHRLFGGLGQLFAPDDPL